VEKQGEQLIGKDQKVITDLNVNDETFFTEDNFNAPSIKLVFRLK
jgi:hypothetical protein